MQRQWGRRAFLAATAAGLGSGVAGCQTVFGTSESDFDPSTLSFGFAYETSSGGPAVRIEHTGSGGVRAADLVVRTSDGDEALWSELGSTTEQADEQVTSGSTARIGPGVVNWPDAVPPSETVKVLYEPEEKSVTELGRYSPPTPTPTATPTPTPTATPTATPVPGLVTAFEDGDRSEWTTAERGASGSATWSVTSDHPVTGEYAAVYRGDRKLVIASESGLQNYPSRGDTVEFRFYKENTDAVAWFGFGVQSATYSRGYRVRVHNHNWENDANTAMLRRLDGPDEKETLDQAAYEPARYAGERLRWTVQWTDPTIRVKAFDSEGTELVSLRGDDRTYDSGGVAIAANSSDPGTVYADRIRIVD
ncbi:hypothetical protein [Halosimplex sp. J119]